MIRIEAEAGRLCHQGRDFRAVVGRGGVVPSANKLEGDGATPLGSYRIVGALLRPDRVMVPRMTLPWRWLRPWDGWSDDPLDPQYNRPVSHPHRFRAERLWRADHVYDVILATSHNSAPVVPGLGSAIFLHLARSDWAPTAGCIAVTFETMLEILPRLLPDEELEII